LIQARGYSAAAAGAAYLPFTLVMGVLARWGGGLVDRFGARWPLIVGPALTALGFVLLGSGAVARRTGRDQHPGRSAPHLQRTVQRLYVHQIRRHDNYRLGGQRAPGLQRGEA